MFLITDWNKIKAEYIAGNDTLQELAEKYSVSSSTIMKRAAKEKWADARKKNGRKKEEKTAEKIIEKQSNDIADGLTRLNDLAFRMLEKLEAAVDEIDEKEMSIVTQVRKNTIDEDGDEAEITTKTENLYVLKNKVQTSKLRQITSAMKDVKEILSGDSDKSNEVKLIIGKDDFDEWSV